MTIEQQPKTADENTLARATEQLIEETPAKGQEPAPQAPKEPAAQEAPKAAETDDDREIREANEALVAEQAKASEKDKPPAAAKETPPAEPGDKPATEQPPAAPAAQTPPADDKNSHMIPKARLDEVLGKLDEAKNAAAYYKGIADARKELGAQPTRTETDQNNPVEATKTVQELLGEINAQKMALAEKYENGEMTAPQWTAEQIKLDGQAQTLREGLLRIDADRIRAEAISEARNAGMEQRLDENAAVVEKDHPGLLLMPKDGEHPHWAFLREEAARSLAAEGVVLRQGDSQSMVTFHRRMGELADRLAPGLTGKPLPAPASTTQSGTPPKPPVDNKQPSKVATQRLEKLALSHQQPPDTGGMGSSGTKPELSDAQLTGMTDDEIANLPAATRARVKGIAA